MKCFYSIIHNEKWNWFVARDFQWIDNKYRRHGTVMPRKVPK